MKILPEFGLGFGLGLGLGLWLRFGFGLDSNRARRHSFDSNSFGMQSFDRHSAEARVGASAQKRVDEVAARYRDFYRDERESWAKLGFKSSFMGTMRPPLPDKKQPRCDCAPPSNGSKGIGCFSVNTTMCACANDGFACNAACACNGVCVNQIYR